MNHRDTLSSLCFMSRTAMVLAVVLLLNACTIKKPVSLPFPKQPERTPPPSHTPASPPPTGVYSPSLGPAKSLYQAAEEYLSAGDTQGAELKMERALRIEPRNGHYWYTMARIKYRQREYNQTVQFCLKSKSLAGRNRPHLRRLNESLIRKARNHLQ